MGREKAPTAGGKVAKAKKPKTEIQRKREERRSKKPLPRPAPLPSTEKKLPKDKKDVKPKPKPQNPGFMKWAALFKRELIVIETHIKHAEAFKQHWRSEMDKMDEEQRRKWENGEEGNWVRLQKNLERTREILALAREANAWIVPKSKMGLNKQGLGMKGFVLSEEARKRAAGEAVGGQEEKTVLGDSNVADAEKDVEDSSDPAPAEFVPLSLGKKGDGGEAQDTAVEPSAESNPYFVVDTNPTPVNLNGAPKKSKKRAKSDDTEEPKITKKSRKEQSMVVPVSEPEVGSISQPSTELEAMRNHAKLDFSSIEASLQAEIEAGQKAKDERAAAKLAKKEKKRKRVSEGDSKNEVKKSKKEKSEEKTKRKAEDSGEEDSLPKAGNKKKHKAVS